ncbi:MAG TPA: glycosyltransferase family 4 protein [Acidobacteriota bacterium]|nr:glycosyltransferase family 4 protein [Acidobacteriota bacterium]
MRPAAIHQLSVSAAYGDAIGNEALQIRQALRAAGHESAIFAEIIDPRVSFKVRAFREYREVTGPDNVVLLHYSLGSAVSKLAREIDDRLVLIYHNITPAEWFIPYELGIAHACAAGRLELASLRERTALALGDSEYNRKELEELGFEPTGVLPLLLDLSHLDEHADRMVLKLNEERRTTWLFVGRIVPNKRFEDLIRAFTYYRRYIDHRAQLLIVGDYGPFVNYYYALQRLMDEIHSVGVQFVGHVSEEELRAYYRIASVFVCLSEHEGFCVPLFEAIHGEIPVIAFSAAAVPYSTGGGVLLLEDKDPAIVSETVACVLGDADLRRGLLERQRQLLQHVDPPRVIEALFAHLNDIGVEV